MKFKKIMFVGILLLAIFAIGAVSASDTNDTAIASEDTGQIELSSINEITEDNLQTSEESITLTQANDDETVGAESDSQTLTAGEGNYSDLRTDIKNGGNLTKSYYHYVEGDGATIEITTPNMVIDGKGAIIDMAGSNIRVFDVTASGVLIKNLIIKNTKITDSGGAIYFSNYGTVENCNLINNSVTYVTGSPVHGGAIYFGNSGSVENCNFTNNSATFVGGAIYFGNSGTVENCNFINNYGNEGGAIHFENSGAVENCNFTNNSGRYNGAIYFNTNGNVTNCNFINNKKFDSRYYGGGAIYFGNSGAVENCNFTNNTSEENGGAIYLNSNGNVTNCNFIYNTANYRGGAVYFYKESNVTNCNFVNNTASNNGGAIFFDNNGTVENCNFVNNTASNNGGAILLYGGGTVTNCKFVNNSAGDMGGAILFYYRKSTVTNCKFTNNCAGRGGAIYFYEVSLGEVLNCNFINNTANYRGGAVYTDKNCNISSSIFLLNKNTFGGNPVHNNCWYWFGNNASNYETKVYNFIDSWLFLDAASTPVAGVEGKSSIVFNLKLYNSTSKSITTPDIPNLPDMVFDLSATNGYLSKYSARLGEPVIFTSTIDKDGNIKASYNGVSCSIVITSLNLEAPDVSKYYNGSERFIVTLSDSAHKPVSNKNVSITIDGKTTTGVTDDVGQFSIPLDLYPGNYIVTSSYKGLIVRSNVNIYSTVGFGNVEGAYKDVTFDATILDSSGKPAKGKEVKIKVGNLNLTAVSDSNGVVRVSPDLDAGNYVMTITNPVTGEVKSTEVVISKASSTISISSETFAHGVTLTATIIQDNISGEVVFTINGNQHYDEDVVNSKSTITLRNLESGKYTAVVTFKGNSNYNASTSSQITFDVDEYDYVISAPDVTKDYGGPEKFNITLTKNNAPIANANVKITINGVNYTKTTDNNGKVSIDINNLDVGIYGVVVKYDSITANSVIIVNQLPTNIDLSFVKHSSDNVTLTAKIIPSVTGELVFTVKGNDYKVNITSGKALLNLAGMDDGNYSAKAVYKGAVNYKSSTSNTVSFLIDKNSIFIYALEVTKEYGGPERFNITLTRYNVPVANVNVEITIGGIDYNEITDNEGKISMNISDLNVGIHDVVVKYDSVSVKSVITVNLVPTKISWSPAELTTVYNVNKNLVATLIDSNGNPIVNSKVTINFSNGKTLTPTTNAKGQVTISTKGLTPVKTYTASITFAGNAIYKKSTATVKITVKKATPKLTAKKKTFKKALKTKKYTIVLKDNLGKAIKNAKVSIKVGKKTYTAKTNNKGKATFKIKKFTKKGTFKATVTYKGNAYYNKVTKKVNIKIK